MTVAERVKPRVVLRPGHAWMSHRELAAVQREVRPPTCGGTLRFVFVAGRWKEAQCDCCRYTTTATEEGVRLALAERDKLEEIAAWRRGQWWND